MSDKKQNQPPKMPTTPKPVDLNDIRFRTPAIPPTKKDGSGK